MYHALNVEQLTGQNTCIGVYLQSIAYCKTLGTTSKSIYIKQLCLSVCPRIGSYTVYVKAEMTTYNDRRGIEDVQWVGLSKGVQGQRSCGGKKHVEPLRNDLRGPNLVRKSSDRSLIHSRGQRSKVGSNFNLLRSGSNLGKVILHMG